MKKRKERRDKIEVIVILVLALMLDVTMDHTRFLISQKNKEAAKQESEDSTMKKSLLDLNQTPWPNLLVPGIPEACDMVNKVYDWRDEDCKVEIKVYMSKEEAEAYFSKLKDLGICQHSAYISYGDLHLNGAGDGFNLVCSYFIEDQYLRINYYYKNY